MRFKLGFVAVLVAAVTLSVGASTAGAQNNANQTGLVNVAIGDVTVQLPIAIAANVCDVNIGVLVGQIVDTGSANCTADADSTAVGGGGGGGGNNANQTGLVNVAIGDVTIQAPISLAANLCDIDVAVLAGQLTDTGAADCTADASSAAGFPPGH